MTLAITGEQLHAAVRTAVAEVLPVVRRRVRRAVADRTVDYVAARFEADLPSTAQGRLRSLLLGAFLAGVARGDVGGVSDYDRGAAVKYVDRTLGEEQLVSGLSVGDQGFQAFEPIEDTWGNFVTVEEALTATEPCIGMTVSRRVDLNGRELDASRFDAVSHLTLQQAEAVRDRLSYLITHHYRLGGA